MLTAATGSVLPMVPTLAAATATRLIVLSRLVVLLLVHGGILLLIANNRDNNGAMRQIVPDHFAERAPPNAVLAGGSSLGDAVTAIQEPGTELGSPSTLIGSFKGTAQAFQTSLATQPYLIAAALLVVYLILGLLYESYVHPLTIISTLPAAGVGALLMLMLFGYDLSVIALIGIIMLIGIVKKNGIMMVDFALNAQRERNLPPEEAIYQACVMRFRPIMMTTMCALLGGLPLMLAGGTGSEIRQPLGYAMVGGLLLSQALTLFTTPVVSLYLERVNRWRKQPVAALVTTQV